MKQITNKDLEILFNNGILFNTHEGLVNTIGVKVGSYKTCSGKRYIENWYVDNLKTLKNKAS